MHHLGTSVGNYVNVLTLRLRFLRIQRKSRWKFSKADIKDSAIPLFNQNRIIENTHAVTWPVEVLF